MTDRSTSVNPVRKVFRTGGSVVVPLPLNVRRETGIGVGDSVIVSAIDGEHVKIETVEDKHLEGKNRLYNYATGYDEAHVEREGYGEPSPEYPQDRESD